MNHFAERAGAENALLDLILGLDQNSIAIQVLLFDTGPLKDALEEAAIPVTVIQFPERFLRSPINPGISKIAAIARHAGGLAKQIRAVRKFLGRKDYDVIVTNSLKALLVVKLATQFVRSRPFWVHQLHDILPIQKNLGTRLVSGLMNRVDYLVYNSNATRLRAEAHGISRVRSTVIYQGFRRPYSAEALKPGPKWVLGAAGRLSPVKNYEFLVRLAEALKSRQPYLQIVIAGQAYTPLDRGYEKELLRLIDTAGVGDTVKFVGFRTDIWSYLDSLDAFILCSHTESFGRVVAEAMWSGKPVIAARVGAIPELIQHGMNGYLFDAGDVHAVVGLVEQLMTQRKLAEQIGQAARGYAESHLSDQTCIAAWQRLLANEVRKRAR